MPFKFNALFASSKVANSIKANLALVLQFNMGVAVGGHRLTRRMAPLRNCINNASDVPGGTFPTNSSRLILISGIIIIIVVIGIAIMEEERGGVKLVVVVDAAAGMPPDSTTG